VRQKPVAPETAHRRAQDEEPAVTALPSSARARRVTIGTVGLIGLLVTGGVLSACSSSTNSSTNKTTTTAASTSTTTGGSSSGSSDASQFQALSTEVQAGQHATYSATYTSHNANGTSQTITIEQKPPKSVLSTPSGSVINDGTHTYFCSTSGGKQQCVSASSAGANPFAALTNLFNPTTLLNEFHAAETAAGSHALGYSADFSNATYAGMSARCVRYTSSSTQSVKYCVTNSGILAYAQSAGGTFELTGFSAAPPASDFSLPAGATVITIPDVSIPSVP
jgi:hypothetical protein